MDEEDLLLSKYNTKGDDKINYREFCTVINQGKQIKKIKFSHTGNRTRATCVKGLILTTRPYGIYYLFYIN